MTKGCILINSSLGGGKKRDHPLIRVTMPGKEHSKNIVRAYLCDKIKSLLTKDVMPGLINYGSNTFFMN